MKVKKNPETKPLSQGSVFRTFKMVAEGNTIGPYHFSSEESVLVILEGKLMVRFPDGDFTLAQGEEKIIPAGVKHYLEIIEDTQAIHVMPVNNKIKFISG